MLKELMTLFVFLKKTFKTICPAPLMNPAKKVFIFLIQARSVIRYRLDMILFSPKTTMFCPCCGMKYRSFVAGGYQNYPKKYNPSRYEHTKQEVLCPFCRALPRHRMLALWFEKHIELLHKSDILYFAPGRSEKMWLKRNKVSCVTADLYSKTVDLKLDIQATGLPESSYDVIVCNHVLEHVDDFRKALKEMYRILRPGGSFICSFPMDPKIELLDEDPSVQTEKERLRRFGQKDHLRVFGMKADLFLTEAGFEVERIEGKDYPKEILPVVGPGDYDMNLLFRCVKPEKQ